MENNENIKIYSNDEAFKAASEYFNGDELAARVWVNKYSLKDSDGNIYEESPVDMHNRLASEIARIENKYINPMSKDEIFDLLKDFKYIVPQGGPMAGIGNNLQIVSLSNCYVIGNDGDSDSYGGIMKIEEEQIQLMKRRGGVGHDLSNIRPKGSAVKNSALTSTGVVPFMERYSNATREVAQDGRRGALMLSLSIKSPSAEDFIDAKMEQGKVTGANISLRIDDEFMEAVKSDGVYRQQYPIDSPSPSIVKDIKAKDLWKKLVHNSWKSAEPGILFWDTIIKESVADSYADLGYKTISTNPCGEIPLPDGDSCRLLAVNLFSYVNNPFTENATFDFDLFKEHVGYAQRFMDDIIDLEVEKIDSILAKIDSDPESEEIKRVEKNLWTRVRTKAAEGRRTGVGITAEGDMLAALGIQYGSKEGNAFSTEVHKTLAISAYKSSVNLAKERGSFKIYDSDREKDNPFVNRLKEADPKLYEDMVKYGRRNIALLTVAPTGSLSVLTQTTSGIEPVFMPVYKRRRKVNPNDKNVRVDFIDEVGDSWEEYIVFHHKFKMWMEVNGIDTTKNYSADEISDLIVKSPYYKATSEDVDWVSKVEMQGSVQKWVDHSISVTVNVPEDTTEEMVDKIFMAAWENGCKGVTIYRDGSRSGVLVSATEKNEASEAPKTPVKRPKSIEADVVRFQNNKEKWIAFLGKIDGKPYEIFTGLAEEDGILLPRSIETGFIIRNKDENGNSRYDFQYTNARGYNTTIEGLSHKFNPEFWNYAKMISGTLRHGMEIEEVVELIGGLQLDSESINTWKNGVVRALKRYVPDGTEAKGKCHDCESTNLMYQEGCLTCKDCGSSKCG